MPKPQKIDLSAGLEPSQQPIDLSAGLGPTVTPTTGASISAATPESWLDQVHDDLLHGGGRTIVGRALGHIEGNGDKGYQGLESGVSPAAAQYMGSLPLGAIKMAKGTVDLVHGHPLDSIKDTVGGELQAATIPLSMMGGPESEAAMARIPSRAHAIDMLQAIEHEAKNVPVYMEQTAPALEAFGEHVQTGGKNAKVMSLLRRRIGKAGIFARKPAETPRIAGLFPPPDVPLGTTPVPGEMPGELVDADRFPPQNVAQTRVIRNGQGQILPRPERMTAFPNENGVMPPARNPYNGQMLTQRIENLPFTRQGFMSGSGEEMYPAQEFSGPGVLRPRYPIEESPLDEFGRVTFDSSPLHSPTPDGEPIYFPEARRFYTNVDDVTRKPGVLGQLLESARNPRLRAAAGGVRSALNSDLTNAASTIGRGEDYANALREYRNAMRLRKFILRGSILAGAEAARRTGILGHITHDLTLGH